MRLKRLLAGTALVVAVGVWQVRAEQGSGAKKEGGPDADLRKHGEYLVNRVAMCGDCHTPRDAKGEPDKSKMLRGATLGIVPKKKTEHWAEKAPDITGGGLAGKWKEEELVKLLTTGESPHGHAPDPPMPPFRFNTQDARAVALYLKSLPGSKGGKD